MRGVMLASTWGAASSRTCENMGRFLDELRDGVSLTPSLRLLCPFPFPSLSSLS